MGIRGLTTFIHQAGNDQFMENYRLPHNSFLIMDGDSVAITIYLEITNKNTCFGGDYDKYAVAVRTLFKKLSDCKIKAYILFDGATEPRKTEKCYNRLNERIQASLEINSTNENKFQVVPIFITDIFRSLVKESNIPMVICNFECDKEVANIAHQLNCPVLALDSDYFIFDVKYIPLQIDNVQNLHVFIEGETKKQYLECKIFNREKFLTFTRLTLEKLPILTVYLGNDYISRVSNIPQLCNFLNLSRGYNFTDSIIKWLAVTPSSEAISKMLKFSNESKEKMYSTFTETIDYYTCKESHYLKYLQPNFASKKTLVLTCNEKSAYFKNVSNHFLAKYRQGFYSPKFLDILLFHEYRPRPLVEVVYRNHSYTDCFPIINAIHKILTGNYSENLIFYGRTSFTIYKQSVPKCNQNFPYFDQLELLNRGNKLNYFFEIVDIEQKFIQNCLSLFPNSWYVMVITIKYMSKRSQIEWPFIDALVLCHLVLSHIDKKIGCIRSQKDFDSCTITMSTKYKKESNENCQLTELSNISQAIEEISLKDCVRALEKMLPYFEMAPNMKYYSHLFNRNLVHNMSKFQCCLLHIDFLNDLFGLIFEKCCIWECYNGTFIYNILSKVMTNANFIDNLLESSPTILRCLKFIDITLRKNITLSNNNSVFDFEGFLNI